MRLRRSILLSLVAMAVLLSGCAGDDQPTAADLKAEAKVQTKEAAEKGKEALEDGADKAKETADDVADGPDADAPKLQIVSPAEKAEVAGSVVEVKVTVEGITIAAADGDDSGRTGHFHVFVDRAPVAVGQVIPTAADIVHSAVNPIEVGRLSPGNHTLTVVLGDGNHRRILAEVQDQVTVNVTA